MKRLMILSLTLLLLAPAAFANTLASSSMIFQGTLTDNLDGTYSGVIAMIDEGGSNSGNDVFAEEGANAWFGDDPGSGPVWTSQLIDSDNDAWPTWTPDTPDWYAYSLSFYSDAGVQRWAVRNHAGASAAIPWSVGGNPPRGVPMSGVMDWVKFFAAEKGM